MSLLEIEHVEKTYGRGPYKQTVLHELCLEVEAGEMVAIWGMRRSGRTTLLRVAAGIEVPDAGVVRFAGRDLRSRGSEVLGGGIAFCRKAFPTGEGNVVLDHLTVGQLARGVPPSVALQRARRALERAGAEACAVRRPGELDSGELIRVAIARALTLNPQIALVDEPTIGVDLLVRDKILKLLHSLAAEGMAVVTTTGETTSLSGARAMTLSEGELHGASLQELASVVPLRRPA